VVQECRLRELTYSAEITVDIEYTRGKDIVVKKGENGVGAVVIGRLPLMLRSDRCRLKGCNEEELARLGMRDSLPDNLTDSLPDRLTDSLSGRLTYC
jgi:DNA-directed RNA polymerase beta subunit